MDGKKGETLSKSHEHAACRNGCGVCHGDPEAIARQQRLEELNEMILGRVGQSWAELKKTKEKLADVLSDEGIDYLTEKTAQKISTFINRGVASKNNKDSAPEQPKNKYGVSTGKKAASVGLAASHVIFTSGIASADTPDNAETDLALRHEVSSAVAKYGGLPNGSAIEVRPDGTNVFHVNDTESRPATGENVSNHEVIDGVHHLRLDLSPMSRSNAAEMLGIDESMLDGQPMDKIEVEITNPISRTLHDENGISQVLDPHMDQKYFKTEKDRQYVLGQLTQATADMSGLDISGGKDRKMAKDTKVLLPYQAPETFTVDGSDPELNSASEVYHHTGWDKHVSFEEFARIQFLSDPDFIRDGWEFVLPSSGQTSAPGETTTVEATAETPADENSQPAPVSPGESGNNAAQPEDAAEQPNDSGSSENTAEKPDNSDKQENTDNSQTSETVQPESPKQPIFNETEAAEPKPEDEAGESEEQPEQTSETVALDVASEEQVKEAYDQMVATIKSIENPYGRHSTLGQPTIVADRLSEESDEKVAAIMRGETNLEYLQNRAFTELSYSRADLDIDDVARLAVRRIYRNHGIEPSQQQLEAHAADFIAGQTNRDTMASFLAENGLSEYDLESTPIHELQNELERQVEEQAAELEPAVEKLASIGVDTVELDLGNVSRAMISDMNQEQLRGDSYYYVLDAINQGREDEYTRGHLQNMIYSAYGVEELLANQEYYTSLEDIDYGEPSENIEIGIFLSETEASLVEKINSVAPDVEAVIDKVGGVFESVADIDQAGINRLTVQRILGADVGFLRMEAMQIASETMDNKELEDLVSAYVRHAFDKQGIAASLDGEDLAEITGGYLDAWQNRDAENREFDFAPGNVAKQQIEQTKEVLLGDLSRYIPGDLELEPATLNKYAREFLNTGEEINQVDFDIRMLRELGGDYKASLPLINNYLQEFYNGQIMSDVDRSHIYKAIAMKIAGGADPAKFVSQETIDELGNYVNPEQIFEGELFEMSHNEGQDLRKFLKAIGVDVDKLMNSPLNRHLTRNDDGSIVSERFDVIWIDAEWISNPDTDIRKTYEDMFAPITGTKYKAVKGDSYSEIASRYINDEGKSLSWKDLAKHNRISYEEAADIGIGDIVYIPEGYELKPEPKPQPEASTSIETGGYFDLTGAEIKAKLKEAAPNGESGHLDSAQLEKLGDAWGDEALYPDAAESFRMMSEAFEAEFGHHLEVVDAYRSYEGQVATKKWWEDRGKGGYAATPGTSNHGWGLAIDLGDQNLNGPDGAGLKFNQEEYDWLAENMSKYGWETPHWAHDGEGIEEAWHKEYVGRPEAIEQMTEYEKYLSQNQTEVSERYLNRFPIQERYDPGSEAFIDLFEAAADYLGLPREWAHSEALHKLVGHESIGGQVGIPNYRYGSRQGDKSEWDDIHQELKRGEIRTEQTPKSSATGLGQLILDNVDSHYPSGADGIGVAFEEAVGTLSYIESRYETPKIAWGNHSANPNRWEDVPKIYTSEGY